MPDPATLTSSLQRYLDVLPPFEASSNVVQATLNAVAKEADRIDAAREAIRLSAFPNTATDLLAVYEEQFGLSVNPPDKTLDQRRTTVLAYLQSLESSGFGMLFRRNLGALIGTNWSYQEHNTEDPLSPPGNLLAIKLPFSSAIGAPTGLAAVAGTGGTMLLGTYHYAVTANNFFGETLPTADVQTDVADNGRVTLTWNPVSDATSYSVYRGVDVASRVRIAGAVTDPTYTDTGTDPIGSGPPSTNTTASFQVTEAFVFARRIVPAHVDIQFNYGGGFIMGVGQVGVTPL